ncbi:helix-turn-helix domain-containing protein [Phaeospirillum tilakii]|uniref:Helix-turn-helix domain-containing protein n=1 Tax=Phaeospirillum tilakii TaxID=741673 RepID=A0ABW5C6R1_9PROT
MRSPGDTPFMTENEGETAMAHTLSHTLAGLFALAPPRLEATITVNGQKLAIPLATVSLLAKAAGLMAGGHPVDVVAVDREMSAQEAADLLKVSRPYLMNLLNQGILPFRKVGAHHRLPYEAVIAYKREQEPRRRAALDALAAETQTREG